MSITWDRDEYRLARSRVKRWVRNEDGSLPPAWEEKADEALALAWMRYGKLREKRPDWDAKRCLFTVCKFAAKDVLRGRKLVRTAPKGHLDAMDVSKRMSLAIRESLVERQDGPPVSDPWERTVVESIIELLPTTEHKAVARLLSYGHSKVKVAELRGCCLCTVKNRVVEIREELSGLVAAGG